MPYLDLPIQHCDDAVLKAMNRRGGRKEIEDAIARLRAAIPGITLRTTLIAGFPGETEEQYAELCDFVKTVRFDRLGCFAYSAEENTVAAKMPNQIDEETKQRRADHIMELQAEVSAEREARRSAIPMSASATASTTRPACTCCAPRPTAPRSTAAC